jgi:radical SAM superfamily enzyme YgiQ (UPF0313 family)
MAGRQDRKQVTDVYSGFEQGPIRPPSEASSLLIRLTRNCPWNRCTFCSVYKGRRFSLRSPENIIKDIDLIHTYIHQIKAHVEPGQVMDQEAVNTLYRRLAVKDRVAFNAAMNWYASGMNSVFLQDANSLIMKPARLIQVLTHLKACFPEICRITSYARSHTLLRIRLADLEQMGQAGLNRIHIGMESGSDRVLKRINKGVTKDGHIRAGRKVRAAGIGLSEYVMPGLGGMDLSIDHALETASALNAINPEYIRFRTLAVIPGTPLAKEQEAKDFEKASDAMVAKELRLLLESLGQIDSRVKSDHILNLFETLEGRLPHDKDKMIRIIDRFFELSEDDRVIYQLGRRMGFFRGPADMVASPHLQQVREACIGFGVTPANVDEIINQLMKRFV